MLFRSGYCIPGIVLTGEALIRENPEPSDEDIRLALNGNLCRCTGYEPQNRAIKKAAELLRSDRDD